ncbi:peptide MFS transporter [Gemella sp. GH3]|nr:peptide MFS transporter [Gemella sp. GH3.1]NYS51043.1 peptide MFS transporter [Gemella sp. GH3]
MNKIKKKHPIGLQLANLCTGLNSFYTYGVVGYLFLFLTSSVEENGLGFSVSQASDIYGTYSMLAFMAPLLGGILADRYLGLQKTIALGTFASIFYYISFITILPSNPTSVTLWICFGIGILASGLGKGNVSALVGEFYKKEELTRRDEAYSIFYMATNIGSFLGPIIVGYIVETKFATFNSANEVVSYGFKYAFLTAAILNVIQFLGFIYLAPKWLKKVGKYPSFKKVEDKEEKNTSTGFTKEEKGRILAMIIMFVFVVLFWSAWYQTQTSFSLLAKNLVDRSIFGFTMPISWLISFNGILCVVLAPVLAKLWVRLDETKRGDLSVSAKMALGMILSGIAFGVLVVGLNTLGGVTDGSSKMSIWYILLAYLLLTVGELMLSPIGMSLFNKLSPAKYSSFVMAIWYLSFSLANKISSKLTGFTESLGFTKLFGFIAIVVIVFGVILLLLKGYLEKLMALEKFKDK